MPMAIILKLLLNLILHPLNQLMIIGDKWT